MFLCPDKIGNVLEELIREKQSSLKRSLKVDAKLFRLGMGLVVGLHTYILQLLIAILYS